MAKALDDITVIDVTRMAAGPISTWILAQLGAEVIKIEEPGQGDPLRLLPPFVNDTSYNFLMVNSGKKSVTLNLKSEQGQEIFRKLIERGDVVVNNFTPGVMERLGLGYEDLKQVNPRLIYAATSGFGQTGPLRDWKSYDAVAQAMAGLMTTNGQPGGPPTRAGASIADFVTPLFQAIAIVAAIHHRTKTGRGQSLDVAQLDATVYLGLEFWGQYLLEGTVPGPMGNRYADAAPANSYRARDGYVFIFALGPTHWEALVNLMGQPELLHDARLVSNESRIANMDYVDGLVQAWVERYTVDEVLSKIVGAGLVAGPVLGIDQVIRHPQVIAREMVVEQEHPTAGTVKLIGSPIKASETPGQIGTPAPALGAHNEEIYRSLLGYSERDLEAWRSNGVI